MFPNTITLTVGSEELTLLRVNQDNFGSEYRMTNGVRGVSMKIRHSVDKVDGDALILTRHNVLVEHVVYPTPTTPMRKSTCTITLRYGKYDNPADSSALFDAVAAWLGGETVLPAFVGGAN